MSASGDDDTDPVLRKYAPKWSRERPAATNVERQYVNLPKEEHQDRRIRSLLPEREPPARRGDGLLALKGGCVCDCRRIVGHFW
jgi:hypothetical protein